MHGLVAVDKGQNVLRPSIIWLRQAVLRHWDKAFATIGGELC
jgi:xylulokinase